MTEDQAEPGIVSPRRRTGVRIALAAFFIIIAALLVLWSQREPIARDFVDRELARRSVAGSYELTGIGFSRQRVENVVIGDPDDPDLTAEWAEIHTRITFGLPEVRRIVARGVRLRGRLVDGAVSFGELDKLLPEPSGEPFALPEIAVDLSDAQLRLATPYGPIVMAVAGGGYLPDGFSGIIAAGAGNLSLAGCDARGVRLTARVAIEDRAPRIDGPLRASGLSCASSGLRATEPALGLDVAFSEGFDRWNGEARLALRSLGQGDMLGQGIGGTIAFAGGPERSTGRLALRGEGFRLAGSRGQWLGLDGDYRIEDGGAAIGFSGDARVGAARLARASVAPVTAALSSTSGSPIGSIGAALARALDRAATDVRARFRVAAFFRGSASAVRIADLAGSSRSGARFALEDGEITRRWPGAATRFKGNFTLAGGGFPTTRIALSQSREGAPLTGSATIAPMIADGARLALAPVRFTAGRRGTTLIETRLDLSGPIAGGRVEHLRVPVSGSLGRGGALVFGPRCVPLSWARLTVASVAIGPSTLPLCPLEGGAILRRAPGGPLTGGARIARSMLRATIGTTPLLASASAFRIPLARPGFIADDVAIRLGPEGQQSRLDLATLRGDFVAGGVDGEFAGANGQLNLVPLRITEGSGGWTLIGGELVVEGEGALSNTADPPLFEPLAAENFQLRFAGNLINATAVLREPTRGTAIANVDLRHDFNAGAGNAALETERLVFNERLQPDALTRLTTGIIAEVSATLSGAGNIRWGPQGVSSDGVYRIADATLAAPFGPVDDLDTEIVFTDLLGLRSAPGQRATLSEVNPGVIVENGALRYQILSSTEVRIEEGRWPFAGGEIILEPTTLDFGLDRERRLTFRIEGLDAFRFVEERDFSNLAATGILDGVLPIVFDKNGGRIEDGYLVSRPAGGSLSYTGEISDIDVGLFGTLAFNALELIRYSELTVRFDGELDGEMVTNLDFTGVTPRISREGQSILVAGLTGPLSQIPVRFDITLNAPFQGLLYSVRLLDDPSFLVGEAIRDYRARTEAERNVQPPESDDTP